ncbi:hypothetical protein CAOG_002872 [Capsaspora owczarzaki ATCC 30864]|uniref:Dol-P-Glc:Glc(2)Man(9)GlcNAc(2)-PP-Dol alpha-1,2-glucosyltransferase n=1 Tax=Capsaspora owczarzaki (strain ATCC 30864) TaxID=595528 RepID=A0A0D2VNB5_CAPO3|nr:hypothetical protein CAOG_002872 [Capsaspora owczarzaki ATCC 30864]
MDGRSSAQWGRRHKQPQASSLVPALVLAIALTAALVAYAWLGVSSSVPSAYMDEIFHIPQAKKYCQGRFTEWDPMITTLPGLYLASYILLAPWIAIVGADAACTVASLRAVNLFFALANGALIFLCLRLASQARHALHSSASSHADPTRRRFLAIQTLGISLFPLLFFFDFLYYTDGGSLCFVLLCYALALRESSLSSALAGACAVLLRQSNIVWVAFAAAVMLAQRVAVNVPRRAYSESPIAVTQAAVRVVRANLKVYIRLSLPYVLVGLLFLAFIVWNGSIVVGDKTHHQSRVHAVQVFYFALFALVFSWPVLLQFSLLDARQLVRRWQHDSMLRHFLRVTLVLGACVAGLWTVHHFTFAHDYLLSDNRHYTFYIWRRWYMRYEWGKYLLVPAYLAAFWFMWRRLRNDGNSLVWIALWAGATSLTIVPAPLIEFRYFVVPFMLYRLHLRPTLQEAVMEVLFFALVNAITLYLFLSRSFEWPSEPGVPQRFMW